MLLDNQGGGKRRAVTQRPVPLVTFRDLSVRESGKGWRHPVGAAVFVGAELRDNAQIVRFKHDDVLTLLLDKALSL